MTSCQKNFTACHSNLNYHETNNGGDLMIKDNRDLEEFRTELQKQIMEQIRERYSPAVIDHWQKPRNFKPMENPDGFAKMKGPCGDTMEMFLKQKRTRS
jgi:hypothetical protein